MSFVYSCFIRAELPSDGTSHTFRCAEIFGEFRAAFPPKNNTESLDVDVNMELSNIRKMS